MNKTRDKIGNIKYNNKIINNSLVKANVFNEYFSNIGAEISKSTLSGNNANTSGGTKDVYNIHSIFLEPTNELEVEKYIGQLKNTSSTGPDLISSFTIKQIKQFILLPLTHILNLTLTEGIFPDKFKETMIIPIFKAGDKMNVNNYRPISLINNLAKIAEKAIKDRLLNFINKHNIISKRQFGFKEGVGTEEAIFLLTSKIYEALDQNKKAIAIFLDLQKAFDTVDHKKLLEKSERYGLRGTAYTLIKNYLENRKLSVKIEDKKSNHLLMFHGIPQGTILGPLLYSIYCNEMVNANIKGELVAYADDTVIINTDDSWDLVYRKATHDLAKIAGILSNDNLMLNVNKTKFITFNKNKAGSSLDHPLIIHNNSCSLKQYNCDCRNTIEKVDSIKYLGLHIDFNMKWKTHTKALAQKLGKIKYILKVLSGFLQQIQLKQVYFAFAQSIIGYGIIAWGERIITS